MSAQKLLRYVNVLVEVNRGPMSSTSRAAPPWEVPILRAIHGAENVTVIRDGESAAYARRMKHFEPREFMSEQERAEGVTMREKIEAEYGRLEALYGMHPRVETTMVAHVYGALDEGRFERDLRRHLSGAEEVEAQPIFDGPVDEEEETIDEMRDRADALGVDWDPSWTQVDFAKAFDALTQEAA